MIAESELLPAEIAATIISASAHANDGPLEQAYAWMRRHNALGKAELPNFDPFWVVSKHADILAVSRQGDLFASGRRPTVLITRKNEEMIRAANGGSPHMLRSLLQMDGPEHLRLRSITQAWFLPGNLRRIEDQTRRVARGFVDRMVQAGGTCDFAAEIAGQYPLRIIMEMMGIPASDEPLLQRLTNQFLASTDRDYRREVAPTEDRAVAADMAFREVIQEFGGYFARLAKARQSDPQDDLVSRIVTAQVGGAPLTPDDILQYFILLVLAGHDTTASSMSAGMQALADQPENLTRLRSNPALLERFVAECIRWATPARHFMRSATTDTELRGRRIAAGDWLMLCYPSGNRDEEVFDRPFEFQIDRSRNPHLAFGYGAHNCLGQHLARMEMRIFWEELLPRLRSVERAGPATKSYSIFVSGIKKLPITYELGSTPEAGT